MLAITRHIGERVRLDMPDGTHVWLDVVGVEKGRVKFGILAPKAVGIVREELLPEGERFHAATNYRYRFTPVAPRTEGE